jgi:K+-transporting ATPase ATPase C chain
MLRTALVLLASLSVVTGLVYPALVTAFAQLLFPGPANGSFVREDGRAVGSALIGQPFADPRFFWGRPSATGRHPYDAAASSGSNQGPLHPGLEEAVEARIAALRAADPTLAGPVPVDLVTASASGLDPHVSPAAALVQVPRVARARGLPEARVAALVEVRTERRWLGLLGEPRVSVLLLNVDLERAAVDARP